MKSGIKEGLVQNMLHNECGLSTLPKTWNRTPLTIIYSSGFDGRFQRLHFSRGEARAENLDRLVYLSKVTETFLGMPDSLATLDYSLGQ